MANEQTRYINDTTYPTNQYEQTLVGGKVKTDLRLSKFKMRTEPRYPGYQFIKWPT